MKKKAILEIEVLISDSLPGIREEAYDALLNFVENTDGVE